MRIIAILPQHIIQFSPYSEWKSAFEEHEVLLATSKSSIGLFPEGCEKQEPFHLIEMFEHFETNDLIEKRVLEWTQKTKVDRILSISEFDLMRAARLREASEIGGQDVRSAVLFRDKFKMKLRAQSKGIPTPKFRLIQYPLELVDFQNQNGFPVVLKPMYGSGSERTYILRTDEAVEDFLEKHFRPTALWEPQWLVETFVEGEMFHIDGLILNEQLVFAAPSRYINGCLAFETGDFLGSVHLDTANPIYSRLMDLTEKVVRAFPFPNESLFHLEFFRTPNDEFIFCEVASRMGGGRINDTIRTAFGLDIKMSYVRAVCAKQLQIRNAHELRNSGQLAGFVLVPPKKGTVKEIPEDCELSGIADYRKRATVGQRFEGASSSVDQVASFVVKGTAENEVENRIREVVAWFNSQIKWE